MTVDRETFPVIHAVTDTGSVMQAGFLDRASAVMRALGPRGAVHLRSSRLSGKEFYEIATLLASIQKATGCWLIVNDRVDIALAVRARGVQLASHSLQVEDALAVSPTLAVGASIHSVEEAVAAEKAGASWCVAGTVFETPSHAGRAPARVEFIERVARSVKIPIIAIGGVRPEDVPALKKAGAHGVATIRGAGWDHGMEAVEEEDDMLKTRLPVRADPGYSEPVTRYISAYDSDSGSDRDDHPDGERNAAGASA
ncbi:MAG TPA: thiamine phosphate synthase [Gemmatimonadaceae bacterium]|nr:thiamine phosphate synthase [Gemmatimonadaceae bacterium]